MPISSDEDIAPILAGDIRAAARLITRIEDGDPSVRPLLQALYPHGGKARIVGVTGPPGTGKSTLVDQLVAAYRARGVKVGVVAVDPSSPFTGGAILGDRIRMSRHYTDAGVFIRSMAARGHLGGLARATGEAALVLDAMGCGMVFVETVGVGQGEVDVVRIAHAVVLVQAPGGGDDVQAAKAGIMEIGDVFAVNKARREGSDRTVREIEEMLDLRQSPAGHPGAREGWRPPVLKTEAAEGEGIEELARAIDARCAFLEKHPAEGARLRREQARHLLTEVLRDLAAERVLGAAGGTARFEELLDAIAGRREDPYSVALGILGKG